MGWRRNNRIAIRVQLFLLLNRDRIHDCLDAACDSSRAECEQKLPRLVPYHLLSIDVLKYVNTTERNKNLVDLKNGCVLFEGNDLKAPRVRTSYCYSQRGEILRTFSAQPWGSRTETLFVFAEQL